MAEVAFDQLYGTDLGLGVGARAISLGGAFTAVADDGSALFWNPAGMTQTKTSQVYLSAGWPEREEAVALIVKPGGPFPFTLGAARFVRLCFSGDSGQGDWSGYPGHLLDLSMIDIAETYAGKIDSETCDYRFSLAGRIPGCPSLSWGVTCVMTE